VQSRGMAFFVPIKRIRVRGETKRRSQDVKAKRVGPRWLIVLLWVLIIQKREYDDRGSTVREGTETGSRYRRPLYIQAKKRY